MMYNVCTSLRVIVKYYYKRYCQKKLSDKFVRTHIQQNTGQFKTKEGLAFLYNFHVCYFEQLLKNPVDSKVYSESKAVLYTEHALSPYRSMGMYLLTMRLSCSMTSSDAIFRTLPSIQLTALISWWVSCDLKFQFSVKMGSSIHNICMYHYLFYFLAERCTCIPLVS